jgi:hypothetical protein
MLMQVDRMRLSTESQGWGHPTHEQQMLHFQWFADMGSTEAQRALGQMLTQGAHRDPEQAARYFRSVLPPLLRSLGVARPRVDLQDNGCAKFPARASDACSPARRC